MPNPKRRHSKTRKNKRRTNDSLTAVQAIDCPKCHEKRLPHRLCPSCGYYDGREVVRIEES